MRGMLGMSHQNESEDAAEQISFQLIDETGAAEWALIPSLCTCTVL